MNKKSIKGGGRDMSIEERIEQKWAYPFNTLQERKKAIIEALTEPVTKMTMGEKVLYANERLFVNVRHGIADAYGIKLPSTITFRDFKEEVE